MDHGVVNRVAALIAADAPVPRDDLALAAREIAGALASRHPGKTIEVRVPPFAAVQVGSVEGDGPQHRRGTPPNLVEMDAPTAVRLATGAITWAEAAKSGLLRYSGAHTLDVAAMFPLAQP